MNNNKSPKQIEKNLIPISQIWYQVQEQKEKKYCYKPYRTIHNY